MVWYAFDKLMIWFENQKFEWRPILQCYSSVNEAVWLAVSEPPKYPNSVTSILRGHEVYSALTWRPRPSFVRCATST